MLTAHHIALHITVAELLAYVVYYYFIHKLWEITTLLWPNIFLRETIEQLSVCLLLFVIFFFSLFIFLSLSFSCPFHLFFYSFILSFYSPSFSFFPLIFNLFIFIFSSHLFSCFDSIFFTNCLLRCIIRYSSPSCLTSSPTPSSSSSSSFSFLFLALLLFPLP